MVHLDHDLVMTGVFKTMVWWWRALITAHDVHHVGALVGTFQLLNEGVLRPQAEAPARSCRHLNRRRIIMHIITMLLFFNVQQHR